MNWIRVGWWLFPKWCVVFLVCALKCEGQDVVFLGCWQKQVLLHIIQLGWNALWSINSIFLVFWQVARGKVCIQIFLQISRWVPLCAMYDGNRLSSQSCRSCMKSLRPESEPPYQGDFNPSEPLATALPTGCIHDKWELLLVLWHSGLIWRWLQNS